jgi:phage anti-repressor protein
MNSLIPINYDNDRQTVSAKVLYDFLEYDKSQWSRWYRKNIEEDSFFNEGTDYIPLDIMSNGNETKDFQLTIEMAKELSMMARTEKGKEARTYFLELEKQWNSPEAVMARALRMADTKILSLQNTIVELAPKAEYYDDMAARNHLTNFRDTAKELKIKESDFIEVLEITGYIYRDEKNRIKPKSEYVPEFFEIKEFVAKNGFASNQTLITHAGREKFRVLSTEGQLCQLQ